MLPWTAEPYSPMICRAPEKWAGIVNLVTKRRTPPADSGAWLKISLAPRPIPLLSQARFVSGAVDARFRNGRPANPIATKPANVSFPRPS